MKGGLMLGKGRGNRNQEDIPWCGVGVDDQDRFDYRKDDGGKKELTDGVISDIFRGRRYNKCDVIKERN
jgi:hypothetical protein